MQKNYNYAIYAYGKDWYFGKEYAVGNLDVSFFFKHFETAIIKLQKEALKYFGKVQAIDVERLLLEETGRNVFFMQSLFRKWMKEICQMDSFQQVEKNLYFRMELGEYYEPGLFLYIENKDRNDQKEKRKLRKDNNHCGKDLENLNVDNLSFVGKDFVDTNFQKASMRSSKWDNCAMQGANFSGATLSNAQFYQCILQESIWKHGDFRNVLFEECMMYSGEKQVLKNFCPDYQKIDLEQCCLCGAKFIRCVMSGMDFSKADITDCTFEDCILTGCTFTEEQILWHQLDREKWKLQAK